MEDENRIVSYIDQLETELKAGQTREQRMGESMNSLINQNNNDNLIKWQLNIEEELERIEHLLRRHVPAYDDKGNIIYVEHPQYKPILNEEGIQEILGVLSWYLNKNLILSNFDKNEIKLRVYQFHIKFANFLFLNANKFGLDTKEKRRYYSVIVLNVVNSIEATYYRAMNGEERESFRTARVVHQTENPTMMGMQQQMPNKSKFKLYDPRTWLE